MLNGGGVLLFKFFSRNIFKTTNYSIQYMPKAARMILAPGSHKPQTSGKVLSQNKAQVTNSKSTIQISRITKMTLDQVKEMEHLETYDETINFLFRERRKNLPSSAGCFPSGGPFERDEEDDPYRLPS